MALENSKTLELIFKNSAGSEVTIKLLDPKEDLTKTAVEAAMKTITDTNIFTTTGGDLVEMVSAQIRQVTETVL